ncbi:hypothetical protein [Ekhidna sp.]|uniref:hypothetical protein n=1 Tax=Ekhidna sp. TaxID=2608089 RepID=UPI003BAB0E2D
MIKLANKINGVIITNVVDPFLQNFYLKVYLQIQHILWNTEIIFIASIIQDLA